MECKDVELQIGAWQDGELDAWTAWRVSRHVRYCAACSEEAQSLTELNRALGNAAPLGLPQPVPSAPRRNTLVVPVAALALTTATAALMILFQAQSPVSPLPEQQPVAVVVRPTLPPRTAPEPPSPIRVSVAPATKATTQTRTWKPAARRLAVLRKPLHQLRAIRVSRKPSLLPPPTRPEWAGDSIRYVATLTAEEREAEIISIESELPPPDELKRLVQERSEFVFVQASLPLPLRDGRGAVFIISE